VTIKNISTVRENCYSTKDWAKRRKRKNLVIKKLHNIDPTLGLVNARKEVINEKWKAFKKVRLFSRATMDILLQRPVEAYFGQAKNNHAKNKDCSTLSEEVFAFFKAFLEHKSSFQKPSAYAHYRPYEIERNHYQKWPGIAWTSETYKK